MRIGYWPTLAILLLTSQAALARPGYFRDPTVRGDSVVFVAEGDLWRVSANGGRAQRLTTHPAPESQPVISLDGRRVAFVASYDGAPDVYIMPLAGGEPKRLSFDGGRVWLAGFSPGGEVVYASEAVAGPAFSRVLRAVDPDSGASRELPLADAREICYSDDGATAWFTRFGLEVSGDHAVGYRGGAIAQLWRWSTAGGAEAERLAPELDASISQPMWWQGRLYAVSDAGGRANLWTMDGDGGSRSALTAYTDFDVRGARQDGGRIIYQLGADLHLYDIAAQSDRSLDIRLDSDFLQRRERFLDQPLEWLGSASVDAEGQRVALSARGQAVLAGTGALRRIDIGAPRDARVRGALPSPDGKWIYAIVDQDGRSEIWRYPADGSPQGKRLLADEQSYRWRLWLSPDGRQLAHADKRARLWVLDLSSGANRLLDESPLGEDDSYEDVAWSADSRYLAWSRPASSRLRPQILLAELASLHGEALTSDRYESFSPSFSPDGKWLYFLSNRRFVATPGSPWGDRNTGAMFDKRAKIYALALQPGLRFPFAARNELDGETGSDEQPNRDKKDVGKKSKSLPRVEFKGLGERLFEVGLEGGNYADLSVQAERLYFIEREAGAWRKGSLRTLAIEPDSRKAETFLANVTDYQLAAGGKRLMAVRVGGNGGGGEILLLDAGAKAPGDLGEHRVALGDWKLRIDPALEWRQMFDDAWNMHREFSFDPGMRGVDWNAVRARLRPLLERVNDRLELDDLLGQMSAELGILHSQVRGGEYRSDPAAPAPATLGASLAAAEGGVRIKHIYRTDPELPGERAPLEQPGVDAREGELITAINGRPVRTPAEVALALRARAGEQVLLDLAGAGKSRRAIVQPVPLERDAMLRYGDWVRGNAAKVEAAAGGRIGYLHLYAMVSFNMADFVREFYTQYDRDALIIDVRRNRGGNIDSWILGNLLRRVWAFWQAPHGAAYGNMQQAFRGHLAVLADEFTYSDGETFTAGFKALELGPVIGARTAGAGIWLSDRNRLSDGGVARVAETAQFDASGRWLIEGRGVAPDIMIENKPWATARGGDAQLETAIRYLEERLRKAPVAPLKAQPIPPRGQPAHDGS